LNKGATEKHCFAKMLEFCELQTIYNLLYGSTEHAKRSVFDGRRDFLNEEKRSMGIWYDSKTKWLRTSRQEN
jgi:hypothetical protein